MQYDRNTFDTAQALFRSGQLAESERLCREIIRAQPAHAPALHLLGSIALRAAQPTAAVQLLTAAVRIDGGQHHFHATLGEAYRSSGKLPEAIECYRQAVRLNPAFVEGHNNLGTLLKTQGNVAAAAESFRRALSLQPNYFHAHFNLAALLLDQREFEGASRHLHVALRIQPGQPDAALRLAQIHLVAERQAEAEPLLRAAVAGRPEMAEAWCELGTVCQRIGSLDEAIHCYHRAVSLQPSFLVAHYNLGAALRLADRLPEAIAAFQEALRQQPDFVEALVGLANCQNMVVRPDEAVAAATRALQLQPTNVLAAMYLAGGLQMQADLPAAIATFRRVIELEPTSAIQHSNLVYALNFCSAQDPVALFAEHKAWAARHAEPLTALAPPHANNRDPHRRLRVGYVSAHFRHHAVSFFAEPMIAAHNGEAFEVYLYSDVRAPDEVTARMRARATAWRETVGLTDEQVAQQVRDDQIDILVDLAGHIGGNRLPVFARKPAPVQVTYLGYQNTTGMTAMDYRLTDSHADPPGTTDAYYTEKLIRLPGSFFCFQPPDPAPAVNPLPAHAKGFVTFASLNHIPKLTDEAFATWLEILARVPDSRLLVLAYAPGKLQDRVQQLAAGAGLDPARVVVVNKRPRYDYLAMHHEIDIALDSFPFNGHTTVCDALWMGVPSVMMEGASYASRFGGSTLVSLGLEELIARDRPQYVQIATELAADWPRLIAYRNSLRARMAASPLVDAAGFTRGVEAAYRQMWSTWCAAQPR